MELKKKLKIYQVSIIIVLFVGIIIGHYVIPSTYVKQLVEEESGKYVNYFDTMQDFFKPFDETDNVTAHWGSDQLYMLHSVPSERDMYHFHFGFDEEGFIEYIEQWRD